MLGAEPVQLARISTMGASDDRDGAALAMCGRPFIFYNHQGRTPSTAPLSHVALTSAAGFASPMCPFGGFVAVSGTELHIAALPPLHEGRIFSQHAVPLKCTPRQMCVYKMGDVSRLVIVEADCRASLSDAENEAIDKRASAATFAPTAAVAEDEKENELKRVSSPSSWCSCIRVVDPASRSSTLAIANLPPGHAASAFRPCVLQSEERTSASS